MDRMCRRSLMRISRRIPKSADETLATNQSNSSFDPKNGSPVGDRNVASTRVVHSTVTCTGQPETEADRLHLDRCHTLAIP